MTSSFITFSDSISIPKTFREALSHPGQQNYSGTIKLLFIYFPIQCFMSKTSILKSTVILLMRRFNKNLYQQALSKQEIFNKILSGSRIDYICSKLGIINIYAQTREGVLRNV